MTPLNIVNAKGEDEVQESERQAQEGGAQAEAEVEVAKEPSEKQVDKVLGSAERFD